MSKEHHFLSRFMLFVSSSFIDLQHGVEDVKQHKWFKTLDWDAVLQRKIVVSRFQAL